MADPFDAAPGTAVEVISQKPLEISLSLKPSGGYDASLINVKGSVSQLAELLKIDPDDKTFNHNALWAIALRWNDLARAVQGDEAKKAQAAGKA